MVGRSACTWTREGAGRAHLIVGQDVRCGDGQRGPRPLRGGGHAGVLLTSFLERVIRPAVLHAVLEDAGGHGRRAAERSLPSGLVSSRSTTTPHHTGPGRGPLTTSSAESWSSSSPSAAGWTGGGDQSSCGLRWEHAYLCLQHIRRESRDGQFFLGSRIRARRILGGGRCGIRRGLLTTFATGSHGDDRDWLREAAAAAAARLGMGVGGRRARSSHEAADDETRPP